MKTPSLFMCEIYRGSEKIFHSSAISALIPTEKGDYEVMQGHAPYVGIMVSGAIAVKAHTGTMADTAYTMASFSGQSGLFVMDGDHLKIFFA